MICTNRKILYIHIPKTGGTTIEEVLSPGRTFNMKPNYDELYGWDKEYGWLNHLTLHQTRTLLPNMNFREYLIFTVVRNPWDRLVSEYHWKISISDLPISFHEYVSHICNDNDSMIRDYYRSPAAFDQHFRPQVEFLTSSDELEVTVIRFERFAEELAGTLRHLDGLPDSLPIHRRSDHEYYKSYYNNELVDQVAKKYRADIERFNFEY